MITYGIEGAGDVITLTVGKGIGDRAPACDLFTVNFMLMRVWNKVAETDYPAIVDDLNARDLKPLALYTSSPEELRLGSALKHIKFLTLSSRDFSAADVSILPRLPELESLQIASLADEVLLALCATAGRCTTLSDVYIDSSTVTDACIEGLAKSTSIKELIFRTSQVKVTDASLQMLSAMPSLQRLRLESEHITSEGLRHLTALPGLRQLRLRSGMADTLRDGINALLASNPKCKIQCGTEKFEVKTAARAPKAKAVAAKPLSPKVWKEIERLGGKKRAIRKNDDGLPPPIEEFAHGIAWPKRKYSATLDLDGDPFELQDVHFNVSGGTDEFTAFPSCEDRSLVKVGEASSCYYIALDFKSKNLSDPTLEIIDCTDFDEECLYHTQPLSKFLARLA